METTIEVKKLCKSYAHVKAAENISISIGRGEVYSLLGANGAQKVADILPLTQGIKLLKAASLGLPTDNVFVPAIVMIAIAVICIGISLRFFKWE